MYVITTKNGKVRFTTLCNFYDAPVKRKRELKNINNFETKSLKEGILAILKREMKFASE